jgi:hypothetical protein
MKIDGSLRTPVPNHRLLQQRGSYRRNDATQISTVQLQEEVSEEEKDADAGSMGIACVAHRVLDV